MNSEDFNGIHTLWIDDRFFAFIVFPPIQKLCDAIAVFEGVLQDLI